MKKLLFIILPLIMIGIVSCDKDKSNDEISADQKSLIVGLSLPADELCGLPLKFQSYWVDGSSYVNTGSVEIAVDAITSIWELHVATAFRW